MILLLPALLLWPPFAVAFVVLLNACVWVWRCASGAAAVSVFIFAFVGSHVEGLRGAEGDESTPCDEGGKNQAQPF
jgi:hypothetical protein